MVTMRTGFLAIFMVTAQAFASADTVLDFSAGYTAGIFGDSVEARSKQESMSFYNVSHSGINARFIGYYDKIGVDAFVHGQLSAKGTREYPETYNESTFTHTPFREEDKVPVPTVHSADAFLNYRFFTKGDREDLVLGAGVMYPIATVGQDYSKPFAAAHLRVEPIFLQRNNWDFSFPLFIKAGFYIPTDESFLVRFATYGEMYLFGGGGITVAPHPYGLYYQALVTYSMLKSAIDSETELSADYMRFEFQVGYRLDSAKQYFGGKP